jgi:diguanylate cyclase (GGDEF)-like protein/PAS domain S-box-containing protein
MHGNNQQAGAAGRKPGRGAAEPLPCPGPADHPSRCPAPSLDELLDAGADDRRHGIVLVDHSGLMVHCNARAAALLGIERPPPGQPGPPFRLPAIIADAAISRSDSGNGVIFTRPDGAMIEIHVDQFPGGSRLLVVEDVSHERRREAELVRAEEEYRSLFDNAVCGIYRDAIDGTPLRANRALVTFNGYETEAEYQEAVKKHGGNWYVDPERPKYFMHLMQTRGEVRDLVSEVYSHKTRKKLWITENAWYVRDAQGNPIYIEGTIQDATERVEGLAAIERQANTDPLTGAASRFFFMNKLRELTRDTKSVCVLFAIDLDRFKEVNDLLGHAAGDAVLQTVARRLQAAAGKSATVARLGGDEFAVLVSGEGAAVSADITGAEIVRRVRMPIDLAGHQVEVEVSVGIALYPADAATAKELLNHADLALYQVKSSGKNGFCFFDPELKTRQQRRKLLEAELREAIPHDQLDLHYQPVIDAETGGIVSYEALMRWNHPRRGVIGPGEFIRIAEDAGLMGEFGNWAIRRACTQAALLPAPVSVAVNVSPYQFLNTGIVATIADALGASGLAPERLTLEVTESVFLSAESTASRVIEDVTGLGVKLALDDFGTGYSSLGYLQRYAFSAVKIDRSFIVGIDEKPRTGVIISAIIRLAADLGMEVIAEGVETEAQAAMLRGKGCRYLQGFLYSHPKPFSEIAADMAVRSLTAVMPKAQDNFAALQQPKRTVHKVL